MSIETGLPTIASVPYSILLGFANLLAIAVETEYTFKEAESIKEFIANPDAFAAAASTADAPAAEAAEAAPAAKESSSDDGGGAAMFDDDY